MTMVRELLALYLSLAAIPLAPPLALAYAGSPWQAVVLGAVWPVCWYAWLWGRLRRASEQ